MDVGERRALAQAGVSLRGACLGVLFFFAFGGLLNGRHLHEAASRREFGPARDFWMNLLAPLRTVSVVTRADQLRDMIEKLRKETP